MDRDNTIARLENIAKHAVHTAGEDIFILNLDDGIAIHEAIEALKAQLSKGGTTSDLISRQAALDIFDDYNISVENGELEAYSRDRKRLCELPTVQTEPKKGKWEQVSGQRYFTSASYFYRCSVCGENNPRNTNYCPNCGADMRGEKNE